MSKPTYSLSELLCASRDAANRTRSSGEPSPCVSCKRTLAILPLRYGVIAGDNQANVKALAPALPANLGKKLAPKLSSGSRYAVRSLRAGYVYLFVLRRGKPYNCEATYRVHDTGLLQPVWPYDPGLPVGGVLGLGGWSITVGDPEDIDEARVLFTGDPLSPAMVDRYRDVSLYRNRLQKFDLRTLANSCSNFDDVVDPHSLATTVAEFLAAGNAAAKQVLEKQAFPPFRNALAPGDVAADMGSIYDNTREGLIGSGGVALVLDDPVGIVQELNAWRNDAIEMNLPWLHTVDNFGLSNERKYMVAEALDDVKRAMDEGYIKSAVDDAAAKLESAKYRAMRNQARFGVSFEDLEEKRQRYDAERAREKATHEVKKENKTFQKYQDMLDWDAKEKIQTDFAARDLKAQEEMDKRESDHLAWLGSNAFLHALELYDRMDPVWGQAFASQIALCVLGMNGCASGAAGLSSWWSDTTIAKHNLAWRAMTRNQTDIERETRTALEKAKAAASAVLTAENMIDELVSCSADLRTKSMQLFEDGIG